MALAGEVAPDIVEEFFEAVLAVGVVGVAGETEQGSIEASALAAGASSAALGCAAFPGAGDGNAFRHHVTDHGKQNGQHQRNEDADEERSHARAASSLSRQNW